MQNAYGFNDSEQKKLVRQSSRGSCRSVRSSLSVGAPVRLNKNRFNGKQLLTELPIVTLMPSLKKQNEKAEHPEEGEFDEEKEQAQLEEARKRKERAKKMREQQEKMLADMKAKKEMKLKEEEDKIIKAQKSITKAREQAKANFDSIHASNKLENELSVDGSAK